MKIQYMSDLHMEFPTHITIIWVIRKKAPSTNCRGNMSVLTILIRF